MPQPPQKYVIIPPLFSEFVTFLLLHLLEIKDSLPLAKLYLIVPVPAICEVDGRVSRGGQKS